MMKQVKVASVLTEYKVVLNVGSEDGIKRNDDFVLYRLGDEIVDPDSGDSLGVLEEVIGRGVITHVQENISTLESSEILEGGRKIIRKATSLSYLSGMFSPTTEEITDLPDQTQPFKNAAVGDFAKQID